MKQITLVKAHAPVSGGFLRLGWLLSLILTLTASAQDSVTNGLISRWTFDDPANLGRDAVGTNNGVAAGGVNLFSGRIGSGALFVDGKDGRIEVADQPGIRFFATNSYTLSAWIYPAELLNRWVGVVTKSRDQWPWYGIWLDNLNQWIFGGQANMVGTPLPLDADGALVPEWHHVAIIQDGNAATTRIAIDGVVQNNGAAADANGTGPLWFGGAASVSEFFSGLIDDVRLYNRALSDAELTQLSGAPAAGTSLPLAFLIQPQNAAVFSGDSTEFTAQINSLGYTCQWYRNNAKIGSAASSPMGRASLNTGALYEIDSGATFSVVFTGPGGSITSQVATVTVKQVSGLDVGLVGRWTFDDPANLGKDSAWTNNALSVGGAYSFGAGRVGAGALAVDGSSGHLEVADNPALRFTAAQSFTLAAWIYPATLQNAWAGVIDKSRNQWPWYGIWIDNLNRWIFGGPNNMIGPDLPADPQWHHVVIMQSALGKTNSLYVDGAFINSGNNVAVDGNGPLWLGGAASVSEFFNGLIDDVRLYNRALSEAEVTQLYSEPASTTTLPTAVVQQPADVGTIVGQTVTLTAIANKFGLNCQWYKGSTPIGAQAPAAVLDGGAKTTLTTDPLTLADNGALYSVVFSGASGSVTSSVARLTVKAVPADGLLARYTFDDPANPGADTSALGLNPGNAFGGSSFSANSRIGSGALQVDGVSGRIVVPNVPYLRFAGTDSYTVSTWFQAQPNGNWGGIVTKSRASGPWYGIWRDPNNNGAPCVFSGSAEIWPPTEPPITDGVWHHAAIVQDGPAANYKLYVDGVDQNVPFNSPLPSTGPGDLWIGAADIGEYYKGLIDDVRIYNQPLSASEINALFNVPFPPKVSVSRAGGTVTITFTGALQATGSLSGGWTNVAGATSPLIITNPQGTAFYRSKE